MSWRPTQLPDHELDDFVSAPRRSQAPRAPKNPLRDVVDALADPAGDPAVLEAALDALTRRLTNAPPADAAADAHALLVDHRAVHVLASRAPPPQPSLAASALRCVLAASRAASEARSRVCSRAVSLALKWRRVAPADPHLQHAFFNLIGGLADAHLPPLPDDSRRPTAPIVAPAHHILPKAREVLQALLEAVHAQLPAANPNPHVLHPACVDLATFVAVPDLPALLVTAARDVALQALTIATAYAAPNPQPWALTAEAAAHTLHVLAATQPETMPLPVDKSLFDVIDRLVALPTGINAAWRAAAALACIWERHPNRPARINAAERPQLLLALLDSRRCVVPNNHPWLATVLDLLTMMTASPQAQLLLIYNHATTILPNLMCPPTSDAAPTPQKASAVAPPWLVQKAAFIIASLTFRNPAARTALVRAVEARRRPPIFAVLLAVCRQSMRQPHLLATLCTAIWTLVYRNVPFQNALVHAGLDHLATLVDILGLVKTAHLPAAQATLATLAAVVEYNRPAAEFIVARGGLSTAVEILVGCDDAPGLCEQACLFIRTTITWSADLKAEAVAAGVVPAILKSLSSISRPTMDAEDRGFFYEALQALCFLAFNDAVLADEIAESDDSLQLVLTSLQTLPDDSVCVAAIHLLTNLVHDNETRKLQLEAMGAIPLVFHLLDSRHDSVSVQRACLGFIANATNRAYEVQVAVDEINGLSRIMAAMTNGVEDPFIQEESCRCICHITRRNKAFRFVMVDLGAVTRVLEATRRFAAYPDIQTQACWALYGLGMDHRHAQSTMVRNHAIALIFDAMKRHVYSAAVQEAAFALLMVLCVSNPDLAKQVTDQNGRFYVLQAMCFHDDVGAVARYGTYLLRLLPKRVPPPKPLESRNSDSPSRHQSSRRSLDFGGSPPPVHMRKQESPPQQTRPSRRSIEVPRRSELEQRNRRSENRLPVQSPPAQQPSHSAGPLSSSSSQQSPPSGQHQQPSSRSAWTKIKSLPSLSASSFAAATKKATQARTSPNRQ